MIKFVVDSLLHHAHEIIMCCHPRCKYALVLVLVVILFLLASPMRWLPMLKAFRKGYTTTSMNFFSLCLNRHVKHPSIQASFHTSSTINQFRQIAAELKV
jgi:hypothetical protein